MKKGDCMHTISSYIHNFNVQGNRIINNNVLAGSYHCSFEWFQYYNAIILNLF